MRLPVGRSGRSKTMALDGESTGVPASEGAQEVNGSSALQPTEDAGYRSLPLGATTPPWARGLTESGRARFLELSAKAAREHDRKLYDELTRLWISRGEQGALEFDANMVSEAFETLSRDERRPVEDEARAQARAELAPALLARRRLAARAHHRALVRWRLSAGLLAAAVACTLVLVRDLHHPWSRALAVAVAVATLLAILVLRPDTDADSSDPDDPS